MTNAEDYQSLLPFPNEDRMEYALRLQEAGHEEMFVRKALQYHFLMSIKEFPEFFEAFEPMRLRHIALLLTLQPGRNDYSLARKLRENLGISFEHAEQLIAKFKARGVKHK
ncbi:MAG: hypothetical protein U1A24_00580 [Cypionkella sp.]|uniref:hypothetical protein n=1 Tax=Cypionkella sp. TaxID=2811411 RepID=UPI002ABC3783|nr:hypothetical protein [Cypionkella sp.]MDZ4309042.1 hypothetical protein [Cypionkella sp.]